MTGQFGKIFGGDDRQHTNQATNGEAAVKPAPTTSSAKASVSAGYETVLGPRTKVEGKISCIGPVHFRGSVSGELSANDAVAIDEGATIAADIDATEVHIKGRVIGDVKASKRIVIAPTAIIEGNISTPHLSISEGAKVKGQLDVTPDGETKASSAAATPQSPTNPAV